MAVGFGVGAQAHARATVEAAYAERGEGPQRLLVVAAPLSSLHWRGAADFGDRMEPFHLHLTDAPDAVTFEPTPSPTRLPPEVLEGRDGTALRWFSRGWMVEAGDTLTVADLRFGRAGMDATDPFVFGWSFSDGPPYAARQLELAFEDGEWARLLRRILGASRGTSNGPVAHQDAPNMHGLLRLYVDPRTR